MKQVILLAALALFAQADMQALLPDSTDLKTTDEPQYARGNELYKLIDGGAVMYMKEDFKEALFQEYETPDGKSVNVEIYKLGSPSNATAVFEANADGQGRVIDVGQAARLTDYYLAFRKGPFYVTLSASWSSNETARTLKDMGGRVADRIVFSERDAQMHELKTIKVKNKYQNYDNFKMMADGSFWGMMKEWLFLKTNREPEEKLDYKQVDTSTLFSGKDDQLRATWMGHSTFIVEFDGMRVILDPVLSDDVSPVFFYSVDRFQRRSPVTAEELPWLDAALISHDHYDHLDKKTIKAIHEKVGMFIVPLGLDKYLKKWDVPADKIKTLDWSESVTIGQNTITALPSQHFSGRGMFGQNKTLWASFALKGPHHSLYYSGDTGYYKHFKRIGEKHGPFDLVILDTGQYGKHWPKVHMFPHESVQAHLDLKGRVYLPVHWGSFNLSTHNWYDPIEGAIAEAEKMGVTDIAIPYPGETITVGEDLPKRQWWKE